MSHVALLRGINVGGKNELPMAALRACFEALGCEDVRTYIQSGNVVFRAPSALGLADAVTARLRERHGLEVPVILRSADALVQARDACPFRSEAPRSRHVMFLSARPPAAKVEALDPDRSPGDRFAVLGREIFLCCPNGVGRTKLTNAWFDRQLGVVSTARNWRTLETLIEMALG